MPRSKPNMPQPVSRYHPVLVAFHWALAILIVADLTIGTLVLVHIPNDAPRKVEALRAHMSGGVVILALMILRLVIRLRTAAPAEATTGSFLLDRAAWLSHRALYVAVFGMAGSGLLMGLQTHLPEIVFLGEGKLPASFWANPLRGVHYAFAKLLMALIALHVAGAFYHVFFRHDRLLRRMWFGRRTQDHAAVADETRFWRYAPWLVRIALALPTLLFLRIGWKYLSAPEQVAAGSGILLGSPAAVTDTRAIGAIFLAFAALTLFSLLSIRRLLQGLTLVAVVVAFVTAARVLGVLVDGAAPETVFKLVPELLLLTLSTLGLAVEWRRRRRLPGSSPVNPLPIAAET